MKIVIIGAGKFGTAIIRHVTQEDHEIVVVDSNPKVIERIVNDFDVIGLCGNGVSYDVQKNAGVSDADLVILSSESDEANMVACLIAKKLGAKYTVARVREYEYSNQVKMMSEALNIDLTINPELEAAREISRILNFPGAIKVETFAQGNVDLVEFVIAENSPLASKSMIEIKNKCQFPGLVCAIDRDDDVIIPTGNTVIEAHDRIHVSIDRYAPRSALNKLGLTTTKNKNVMIIGGGRIGLYLAHELVKMRYSIKIIENDPEICQELCQKLPGVTVICGDGTDQALLLEEGINSSDAVICLTGRDEENIIISMYANSLDVKKIVTKVNKKSYGDLLESIDIASVISCQEVVASQIVSYIRALCNLKGSNVKTLYKLVDEKVEAVEFTASNNSKLINIPLKNLKIMNNILIVGIIHDDDVIIPMGDSVISENDSVIVVTTSKMLNDLDDILE